MSSENKKNTPLMLVLLVAVIGAVGATIAVVAMAPRQKRVFVYSPAASTSVEVQKNGMIVLGAPPAPDAVAATEQTGPQVIATTVASLPPLDKVIDAGWDQIKPMDVNLDPQQMVIPYLEKATVQTIQVQFGKDKDRIALRLSWPCAKPSFVADTGIYPDGCAIQIQMVEDAPYTMGAKGLPVRVMHWKSIWQKDIDEGYQDIAQVYPNAPQPDVSWFATREKNGYTIPGSYKDPKSQQYLVAYSAGNSMADYTRTKSVEEIAAEGFGSVTHCPTTPATARGVWKDGRWYVVIDRPLDSSDPMIARLQSKAANVSFAVWDGNGGNRGARKHYCGWIPIKLEP